MQAQRALLRGAAPVVGRDVAAAGPRATAADRGAAAGGMGGTAGTEAGAASAEDVDDAADGVDSGSWFSMAQILEHNPGLLTDQGFRAYVMPWAEAFPASPHKYPPPPPQQRCVRILRPPPARTLGFLFGLFCVLRFRNKTF